MKSFRFLTVFVSLFLVAACSDVSKVTETGNPDLAPSQNEWKDPGEINFVSKTYNMEKWKVSFVYPEEWSVLESSNDNVDVGEVGKKVSVDAMSMSADANLQEYLSNNFAGYSFKALDWTGAKEAFVVYQEISTEKSVGIAQKQTAPGEIPATPGGAGWSAGSGGFDMNQYINSSWDSINKNSQQVLNSRYFLKSGNVLVLITSTHIDSSSDDPADFQQNLIDQINFNNTVMLIVKNVDFGVYE